MTLEEEYKLSYYRQIAVLNEQHGVFLVQHIENGRVFVKKRLQIFNGDIYRHLKEHPVRFTPRIHEVIADGDDLIVIEEYITGTSLAERMNAEGVLSENEAAKILSGVCEALKGLHGSNPPIVHRDIKPSNILLTDAGEVALIDMNAAKYVSENSFQDTRLIGTHGYAAPEQYGFGTSGIQTDIYACGVLLNVMLTGSLPMEKKADGRFGDIVEQCTKMSAGERYSSADELKEAILSGRPDAEKKHTESKWRKFLPPGFRSGKALHILVAAIGYIFFLAVGFSLELKGAVRAHQWVNRLSFFMSIGAVILFSGNYLDVWDKLQIRRIPYLILRIIVILAIDAVLFFVILMMFIMLERALFGNVSA